MMAEKTETQAGFDLSAAGKPSTGLLATGAFVALPEGFMVHDLEDFQARPNRVSEAVTVREVASLAEYLTRFADANTVTFADWAAGKIKAVLDYHGPKGAASHASHSCTFAAQRSAAWAAWKNANDQQKSQVGFGRFLEERAPDVVKPDSATIVETCMSLDAIKKVSFRSAVRLSDGFRQLQYVEDNETKGGIRVPEVITILVPVYEGMEPDRIDVRLRYRMDEGKLTMWVTIDNLADIEKAAFERCIDALQVEHPKVPLYRAIL